MDLERINCLNCGANIAHYDPQAMTAKCTNIGCGAVFLLSRAQAFAKVQVDHEQEIANLRKLLEGAVRVGDTELMQRRAEEIRRLIPGDALASYCEALGQKKRGKFKSYADYLCTAGEMTEWEADRILAIALMEQVFTVHDEEPLKAFIWAKFPSGQRAQRERLFLLAVNRLYEQQNQYANIPRDVFICHSSRDGIAQEVYDLLTDDGINCWISERNMSPDTINYWEKIEQAIRRSRIILCITSKACMLSPDPVKEMELAEEMGLERLELKIDNTEHTVFFRHFFNGIQWIRLVSDKEKAFEDLKERVYWLMHGRERKLETLGLPLEVEVMLTRAQLLMEDGDWESAETYIERALDTDPNYAPAYIARLQARLKLKEEKALAEQREPLTDDLDFGKALRFAEPARRKVYENYNQVILDRVRDLQRAMEGRQENDRKEMIYRKANSLKQQGGEQVLRFAKLEFEKIPGYRDSNTQAAECGQLATEARAERERIEEDRQWGIYQNASREKVSGKEEGYHKAQELYESIPGYRDSDALAAESARLAEEAIKAPEPQEHQRVARKEQEPLEQIPSGHQKADFRKPGIYKFNAERVRASFYSQGFILLKSGQYDKAVAAFRNAGPFKDASSRIVQTIFEKGRVLADLGNYTEAYTVLQGISDYRETNILISQNPGLWSVKELDLKFKIGNLIEFGRYEQSVNIAKRKETLTWRVLAREGRKALLFSEKNLDTKPYNAKYTSVTWETCMLRKWLNKEFLSAAFSEAEKNAILTTLVKNEGTTRYITEGGCDTSDKVFLLSLAEAEALFTDDADRQAQNTHHAKANGAFTDDSGHGYWWLRSPGEFSSNAASISPNGSVISRGDDVNHRSHTVRPALYVNLDVGIF